MHLPLKFLPQRSELILEMIGGVMIIGVGVDFFGDNAAPSDLARYSGFGDWLSNNVAQIPFLLGSIAVLLFGLAWFTVAALNYFSGSPFNYLIVDRVGITYRNFWRENRYSWKELGPIQAVRLTAWRGRSSQRRHWITADTLGAEGGGSGAFWSNPVGTLRIPSAVYLSGGLISGLLGGGPFLSGTLVLSTNDAASWLEELRQLARNDHLEDEELPAPPSCFRAPISIETSTRDVHAGQPVERP